MIQPEPRVPSRENSDVENDNSHRSVAGSLCAGFGMEPSRIRSGKRNIAAKRRRGRSRRTGHHRHRIADPGVERASSGPDRRDHRRRAGQAGFAFGYRSHQESADFQWCAWRCQPVRRALARQRRRRFDQPARARSAAHAGPAQWQADRSIGLWRSAGRREPHSLGCNRSRRSAQGWCCGDLWIGRHRRRGKLHHQDRPRGFSGFGRLPPHRRVERGLRRRCQLRTQARRLPGVSLGWLSAALAASDRRSRIHCQAFRGKPAGRIFRRWQSRQLRFQRLRPVHRSRKWARVRRGKLHSRPGLRDSRRLSQPARINHRSLLHQFRAVRQPRRTGEALPDIHGYRIRTRRQHDLAVERAMGSFGHPDYDLAELSADATAFVKCGVGRRRVFSDPYVCTRSARLLPHFWRDRRMLGRRGWHSN